MQFTLDDIRSEFDSGTFARGQAYARDGMVRKFAWTNKGCEGEVAGSGSSVYRQSVRLTSGKGHVDIAGSCSCPMDYNCKHVVALLVEAIKKQEEAFPSPVAAAGLRRGEVGNVTVRWLDKLMRAQAAWAMEEAACTMGDIGWVLLPHERGGELYLYLCKIDFLADATIASAKAVSSAAVLYHDASVDLQRGDDLLIRMYLGMRAGDDGEIGIQPMPANSGGPPIRPRSRPANCDQSSMAGRARQRTLSCPGRACLCSRCSWHTTTATSPSMSSPPIPRCTWTGATSDRWCCLLLQR
jgi:hypothetical protein